jgi:glutamate dehydrogenase
VKTVQADLPASLSGRDREAYEQRLQRYLDAGVPNDVAVATAVLPAVYAALPIVQIAEREHLDVLHVARVHFTLGQRLGLDRLLARIIELPRDDRWQTMARAALRDDLHSVHAQLTALVLETGGEGSPDELVDRWQRDSQISGPVANLRSLCQGKSDLARVSVGLRMVRGLLPTAA